MPDFNGRTPTPIVPDDLVARVRTTLSTTSVAAAFLPLISQLAATEGALRDFDRAFLNFNWVLDADGRLTRRNPARDVPMPVKAPPPAPLEGTRAILFEDED
jgi:hypothetical protein